MSPSAKPNCNNCEPKLTDKTASDLTLPHATDLNLKLIRRLTLACALPLTAMCSTTLSAQPDDGFEFEDDLFGDSSLFESDQRFEHTTFRLSHQMLGHLNRRRELETNRLGLNVRYQNPIAPGWLVQTSGYARFFLPGDYEHDIHGMPAREFRVNELYLQRSTDSHSFRFGRQTIVWGETVGNSVLDVINTTEFRDLSIIDIEDARLNQWLLNWDYYGNNATFSSFINLYPDFDRVPPEGSPLRPELPWHLPSQPDQDRNRMEAGTRWSRSFTGSDVAIMAAYLYENQLLYLPPGDDSQRMQALDNDYYLLGFSGNRAIGRLLLTLDLAYSHGVRNATSMTVGPNALAPGGMDRQNRIGTSVGFEYGISNTQQISLSVAAERLLDDESLDNSDIGIETTGNVLLRYSNSVRNENLLLSVTAQSTLDADAGVLNLEADFRVTDGMSVIGQLILTRASQSSPLAYLDQDVRAGITFMFSF